MDTIGLSTEIQTLISLFTGAFLDEIVIFFLLGTADVIQIVPIEITDRVFFI